MTKVYPAIIHEENGSYWVEFPDLEGCSTYGETLEETLDLASEALGLYLVSLSEAGTPLPEASDLSSIICKDGHAIYITTDINKYRRDTKAVKKMLSIPAWLAKEAEARNLSLSKVLQEALQKRLQMASRKTKFQVRHQVQAPGGVLHFLHTLRQRIPVQLMIKLQNTSCLLHAYKKD